jgi:hypothetical protein
MLSILTPEAHATTPRLPLDAQDFNFWLNRSTCSLKCNTCLLKLPTFSRNARFSVEVASNISRKSL